MRSSLFLMLGLTLGPVILPPPPVPPVAPRAARSVARPAPAPAHERCDKRDTVARAPSANRETHTRG